MQSEKDYKWWLDGLNGRINLINTSYKENLNKVQTNDTTQIVIVKQIIEKMGTIFDDVGKVFREHGDSVREASRIINAETDI